jgi:hypothetical protein
LKQQGRSYRAVLFLRRTIHAASRRARKPPSRAPTACRGNTSAPSAGRQDASLTIFCDNPRPNTHGGPGRRAKSEFSLQGRDNWRSTLLGFGRIRDFGPCGQSLYEFGDRLPNERFEFHRSQHGF